jgi:2-polyprenyl-3-methyl-5-hydroxy-6-metoxy-1,4-benzoquinol methylase
MYLLRSKFWRTVYFLLRYRLIPLIVYKKLCTWFGRLYFSKKHFENLYAREDDPWDCEKSEYEKTKYRRTFSILTRIKYDRILEIGCGVGIFTQQLATLGREILGIDISENALNIARKRCALENNIQFSPKDIVTDALDGRFDLIFCAEVLYYLGGEREIRKVRDKLIDLLTDDGEIVLVHPLPESKWHHGIFAASPRLKRAREQMERNCFRPYVISVFQKF